MVRVGVRGLPQPRVQPGVGAVRRAQVLASGNRMHVPSGLLASLGNRLDEVLPVHVIQEDVLPPSPGLIT